jgi:hypothetical protein
MRLTRGEVDTLRDAGRVESEVRFGPETTMRYALAADPSVEAPIASFTSQGVEVRLPSASADRWTGSEDVGIEARQSTGEGRQLRILIEKDFQCLTKRPDEDDSDAFGNPESGH